MQKRFLFSLHLLLITVFSFSQLKSPEEFLGYKIGSRYTPHFKVVNYFNHVAANSNITLEQYGETNEGRPLYLAFISSPENMKNLENIRSNNLRLANLSKDNSAAIEETTPAIVWLSYNVHGNETSSSEAAMLTLFALVDPSNTKTKEWLKNTVVIIDPCLNPDGRDRYVNWFNSVVGKDMDPTRMAREHREPWPGGRTNHYNFDLNRDWVWQTQVESKQRIKMYNKWMPNVHVDYHEQGYNNPYYFAPAAEPFHEVITPWQRDFQTTIGKNHAKYFDRNGWLYYTKIRYDLFYPSYGDTYPTYNGSIGMTYEQGGIGSGLGIINTDGDTLTLDDRITHHFTTSLSTIEISSMNAGRLIKEFHKYFNDAVNTGVGEYKTYIIKSDAKSAERIEKLVQLLDNNGIQYGIGTGATAKGYNYISGKEEGFTAGATDIVIPSQQPRSSMVKVLFEPRSKLSDSATYDITAWSLPYAYGLNTFATKEKLATGGGWLAIAKVNNAATEYGYVLPWNGVKSVKVVGKLLQKGIVLRYAEQPFEINGNKFDRGAVIIIKTSNKKFGNNLWAIVKEIADGDNIRLYPVTSGFVDKGFDFGSDMVNTIKPPRVVLITGEGIGSNAAGEVWHFFESQLQYPITLINLADMSRANWNEFDVIIMPDGNYRFLSNKDELDNFKQWIMKGGRVVALDGAVAQLAKAELGIKQKKTEEITKDKKDSATLYASLKNYEDRERDAISETTPGSIWKVKLDNTNPLAFGYPDYYYTLKQDDMVYEFMKEGWNVGVIKKENQVAGFVGSILQPKLKDGLLFGLLPMGNGAISFLADDVLFRNFWENGKLLLCNAVFLSGQ